MGYSRLVASVATSLRKMMAVTVLSLLSCTLAQAQEKVYYGLFPSENASDSMRTMKAVDETNVVHWVCDKSFDASTTIRVREADSKLNVFNQGIEELSSEVDLVCVTPNREFKFEQRTSFHDMGLGKVTALDGMDIWLTFRSNGTPDTLFIGVTPGYWHMFTFPTPHINFHSANISEDGRFEKGRVISYVAEPPLGIDPELLVWEWYVDGVYMTGREDRWFETYSRTKWTDGQHTISCRYKKKNGKRKSDFGSISVYQETGTTKRVTVYPYWGLDCTDEENLDSTNFKYNEVSQWGSFEIHPLEDYVHFYMEILNTDIQTSTITNTSAVPNFELLGSSASDEDYRFFFLPSNCKGHAREPFSPVTVYFRIEDKNINYSLLPYIKPKASLSPDSVEICENSFEAASESSMLTASSSGFPKGTVHFVWYFSPSLNGRYSVVPSVSGQAHMPSRTGYYKVEATDGVFSAFSAPVKVSQRKADCRSADIYSSDGKDYTCQDGTVALHTHLDDKAYSYQWLVGPVSGENLRPIPDADGSYFYGSINEPGEGYFLQVRYGNRKVTSNPFVVHRLSRLGAVNSLKLVTEASPRTVCPDYSTTLKARVQGHTRDSYPLLYRFYKAGMPDPIFLGSLLSSEENVYFSTPVHQTGSNFFVEVLGCDHQLGSDRDYEDMSVDLLDEGLCNKAVFYVKKSGDDFMDGTSWANAFGSVPRALKAVNELRRSVMYSDVSIEIHIAAGLYLPDSPEGFSIPDNVTIYGGYDEMPTDGTISGTVRNPVSPANPNGYATTFRTTESENRIFCLRDCRNVRLVALHLDGEKLFSSTDGRLIYVDNSEVDIDSCWITGFKASTSVSNPLAAVSVVKSALAKREDISPRLGVAHCSFTKNAGSEWGACLNVLTNANINISSSTFDHNTNIFKGGTAVLSYNASPKINIINSTFYSNLVTGQGGSYGSSVFRMAGGKPLVNIVCSSVCDHFYKEAGTLNIYYSIVECAGLADVYHNNFPVKSTFRPDEKDLPYNYRKFGANFKGSSFNKITTVKGSINQMLVPGNKIEIIGQAGEPYIGCLYDQRGVRRNMLASTFGAYEDECTVAIDHSQRQECLNGETRASFKSDVTGLSDVKYQWVNNYSDIKDAVGPELNNVGLGTYWLEVSGKDHNGAVKKISSAEIRISDICESPGEFFVDSRNGNDSFAGTSWSKALATLDRALSLADAFHAKNPTRVITVNLTAGVYAPSHLSGFNMKNLHDITFRGGFPNSPAKGDTSAPKICESGSGFESILALRDVKGRLFSLSGNKNVRFVGLHFKGGKQVQQGAALSLAGGSVTLDSCWISGFSDGSVIQEGNVSSIALTSTTELRLNYCYISNNQGRRGGGIGVFGSGNTSSIFCYNTTFSGNVSLKTGGSVLFVAPGASPDVTMANCTLFGNRTLNTSANGCGVIRMQGKDASSFNAFNCTLYGTYFVEHGTFKAVNSLVEATASNAVLRNSFVAYPFLNGVGDDLDINTHRRFADSFEYTLSTNCGFVPVLKLKADGWNEVLRRVPSLLNVGSLGLSKDQCGNVRDLESNMGSMLLLK